MTPDTRPPSTELEDLTELLYLMPTGLVQTDAAGAISFINPLAVQLLMPLVRQGDDLSNLFDALERVAPDLRRIVRDFAAERGHILRDYRIVVSPVGQPLAALVVYAITLVRVEQDRIMVSLQDVSESARLEQLARRQEGRAGAGPLCVNDYAVTLLDEQGRVAQWNDGVRRLTGLTEDRVLGRSCTLFFEAGTVPESQLQERLQEAARCGLSLSAGWVVRAGGERIPVHSVITPCAPGQPQAAYVLVLRDIAEPH